MTERSDAYHVPETLNADFGKRVTIDSKASPWLPSPQAGVERRLLDRIGGEVARATSIVRYAPGSRFPSHTHGAGEEFLVLAGTFSDEHGDYPSGTYVRNPPGSSHAPFTREGCTIFVKLRQMRPEGEPHVVVDANLMPWGQPLGGGAREKLLHDAGPDGERVSLMHLPAGATALTPPDAGGEEVLVLEGLMSVDGVDYQSGTWTRIPPGETRRWVAVEDAVCWTKRGHLRDAPTGSPPTSSASR